MHAQRENYPKSYEEWYTILFQCQNCGLEGEGRIDAQGTLWVYGGYDSNFVTHNYNLPVPARLQKWRRQ